MKSNPDHHLPFNFTVNVLDGGFFGAALGFASFITVIPLFVSNLTDSAIIIGLIPAIHAVGWELPQLLTAPSVSKLHRYKPMTVIMSLNERIPFLGLAVVAWFSPQIGIQWSLILTFLLLIWQGFGGGLTATAWQSLMAKIIPVKLHGTFFGIQSSAVNLFSGVAAVLAGIVLITFTYPLNFAFCFLIASIAMGISLFFLALTKEKSTTPASSQDQKETKFSHKLRHILKHDKNFRWYLLARMLTQFAAMGFAFYTIYAVRVFNIDAGLLGILTGLLLFAEVIMNPLLGWLGDRRGHLITLQIGIIASIASVLLAWGAKSVAWFFPIFILAGIASVAMWTVPISMTLEFGSESERPAYIGLANTLVAPSTFLAPILAGWLIDSVNYQTAFMAAAIAGIATLIVLILGVHDPRNQAEASVLSTSVE